MQGVDQIFLHASMKIVDQGLFMPEISKLGQLTKEISEIQSNIIVEKVDNLNKKIKIDHTKRKRDNLLKEAFTPLISKEGFNLPLQSQENLISPRLQITPLSNKAVHTGVKFLHEKKEKSSDRMKKNGLRSREIERDHSLNATSQKHNGKSNSNSGGKNNVKITNVLIPFAGKDLSNLFRKSNLNPNSLNVNSNIIPVTNNFSLHTNINNNFIGMGGAGAKKIKK